MSAYNLVRRGPNFTKFFFQAEDGIRDLVRSRGLGDVYKRQLFRQSRVNVHLHIKNTLIENSEKNIT